MTMLPKPKRELDPKYLEFIDRIPCIALGAGCLGDVTHHHLQKKGHGGKSTKCSDKRAIPLCASHHDEIHRHGRATFIAKYKLDTEAWIQTLNSIYGRIDALDKP